MKEYLISVFHTLPHLDLEVLYPKIIHNILFLGLMSKFEILARLSLTVPGHMLIFRTKATPQVKNYSQHENLALMRMYM